MKFSQWKQSTMCLQQKVNQPFFMVLQCQKSTDVFNKYNIQFK